jgi:hypothetical protein
MHDETRSRLERTLTDQHMDDLMEILEDLLAAPELLCSESGDVSQQTLGTLARARTVRDAVLDERAPPQVLS